MTQALAESLWNARVHGHAIDRPNVNLSLAEAYIVQQQIVDLSGRRQLGWKIGSTSKAAQAKLGTSEPGAAALLEGFCFHSGDTVPISDAHHVAVEGEFAFVIARDMDFAGTPTLTDVIERIGAMIPGIEVVGSRYVTGLEGSGRELVTADGGANIAFIGGEHQLDWTADSLPDNPVLLDKNGDTVATGHGRDALDSPLNVVHWLVSHCEQRGIPVKAGDIVTTGTCTGLIEVSPGDTITAKFPGLGEVGATFSALS